MVQVIAQKYEVIGELGEGGSGKVYRVRHVDLDVNYALKVLNRSLSDDKRFIDRFKREAEVLLRFSHPGSVQLRDFGRTEEGLYYMAMDFCDGVPLKSLLENSGALSPERSINIVTQILSVLEAAHKVGIIHRDIKPDNVMITGSDGENEKIKILDFGIAKLRESIELDAATTTMEGASIGTPHYMAPEQAAGEGMVDHRVDIYATGILMYEMLSGQPPFVGRSIVQTLLKHLTQPPPPFDDSLNLPEELKQVVFKAITKNRDHRYQSALEFRTALETVALGRSGTGKGRPEAPQAPEVEGAEEDGKKILCLDDDEMVLNILKHILEKEGYTVYTASNCSAIHPYLFGGGVSLLVTDVQMPDMSGTKVCKLLKQSVPSLKILLFSNLPDKDLEKLSKESKADGWMTKNAKPHEWVQKIKGYLPA